MHCVIHKGIKRCIYLQVFKIKQCTCNIITPISKTSSVNLKNYQKSKENKENYQTEFSQRPCGSAQGDNRWQWRLQAYDWHQPIESLWERVYSRSECAFLCSDCPWCRSLHKRSQDLHSWPKAMGMGSAIGGLTRRPLARPSLYSNGVLLLLGRRRGTIIPGQEWQDHSLRHRFVTYPQSQ